MLPTFPHFKKLEITDKSSVQEITNKFEPYSDYNFASMWCYDVDADLRLSLLHDNLVVRFNDYITNKPFYSFIGTNSIDKTVKELLELAVREQVSPILKLLPESNFSTFEFESVRFTVQEDPDNYDYILDLNEIASANGKKYHFLRKLVNRFSRTFPNYEFQVMDLSEVKIQQQVIELFWKWAKNKGKPDNEVEHELGAVKRLFVDPPYLNLITHGLYIEKKLIAFLILDANYQHHLQSDFFKADTAYDGAFQILRYCSAQAAVKLGYKYMNIEQDLGIPELKIAKERWNPVKYLKKFKITLGQT